MKKILLGVQFNLYGTIEKEDGVYVAFCPALDVASQADTIRGAKRNLEEACRLFIESCLRRGTLDKALEELGFKPAGVRSRKHPIGSFQFPVEVPYQSLRIA